MKNKKVQALLATTVMTTALVAGCAFNPAEEEVMEIYGPAPIVEEEQTEITEEETEEQQESEEVTEEQQESEVEAPLGKDDFVAGSEVEVCIYGPAPTE